MLEDILLKKKKNTLLFHLFRSNVEFKAKILVICCFSAIFLVYIQSWSCVLVSVGAVLTTTLDLALASPLDLALASVKKKTLLDQCK